MRAPLICIATVAIACDSSTPRAPLRIAAEQLDSISQQVIRAHRERNPAAYGAVHSDGVRFEWPAFTTVHGRAALEELMRSNWEPRHDLDIELETYERRVDGDLAVEFVSYRESWRDPDGQDVREFGRYVVVLARQNATSDWLIDRFFGFADSTTTVPRVQ